MKLDKPLIVASGSNLLPRIVRALLLVPRYGDRTSAFGCCKALERGVPMPDWTCKQCIRVSLWWAGLLALPLLGYSRADHAILDSTAAGGPARWSQEQNASAVLADCSRLLRFSTPSTAAPRLRQSLWDDEIYAVRKIVLGTDRIRSDGSVMVKQLPWWRTLWNCEGARNHGLQSILSRVSLQVYQALVRPVGLQFSETAIRLPSFIAGALSIPALALLIARLEISLGWRYRSGAAGASIHGT